jgi:hypothetical protein
MVSLDVERYEPEGHAERRRATLEDSLLVAAGRFTADLRRSPETARLNGGLSVAAGATRPSGESSGISSHAWHLVVDGGVSPGGELSCARGDHSGRQP